MQQNKKSELAIKKIITTVLFLFICITTPQAMSQSGFIPVDGGKLYYESSGKGNPVVVLHGGPGLDHSYLLPQMMALQKNHEVIFYDQRGSGQSVSTSLDKKFINSDQFVQDLESLRLKLGHDQISLIGHSWGGFLAMSYALKYPQHTKSLIIMNSMPASFAGFNAFLKEFTTRMAPIQQNLDAISHSAEFIKGDLLTFKQFCQLLFSKYLYNQSDINKLALNFSAETAKNQGIINATITQPLIEKKYDLLPELHHLTIPTLVIHGDADPIPLWTAKEISEAIPNAEFVVIKQSGHFSYVEKPDEVLSAINLFFKRLVRL